MNDLPTFHPGERVVVRDNQKIEQLEIPTLEIKSGKLMLDGKVVGYIAKGTEKTWQYILNPMIIVSPPGMTTPENHQDDEPTDPHTKSSSSQHHSQP